ncbi:hypothetical protein BBJ29_010166 [Phytophthora kernoviae]|uniref:RxLR effector protein n=1 Tax=Phytophthora kernoviae TaxID=325452 RepID=A0A421FPZ4_9STRA|nr:hypothetical protein BBJ29_010166 [Phytophthora kernoviae]
MAFSTFLKIFVLLTVNVNAVNSDPARRLRIKPSGALPPTRELSGKNPVNWVKIIKQNLANQPVAEKGKEFLDKANYIKKLKENAHGLDH